MFTWREEALTLCPLRQGKLRKKRKADQCWQCHPGVAGTLCQLSPNPHHSPRTGIISECPGPVLWGEQMCGCWSWGPGSAGEWLDSMILGFSYPMDSVVLWAHLNLSLQGRKNKLNCTSKSEGTKDTAMTATQKWLTPPCQVEMQQFPNSSRCFGFKRQK